MTMTGVRPGDRDRDEDPQVEDDAYGDDLFNFLMDCPRKPANLTKNKSGGNSGGGVVHRPLKKMHRQRECGEGRGMEMIMEKRKAAKRRQGIDSRSLLSKRNHNMVLPAAEIDRGGGHLDFDFSDFSLSQEGEPGATMESITAMERSYECYNKARS
ncbi:hypothetical protein CBR_g54417 [Chara braunii]|uniref:Uncharacterized protein n=1 Tax=Chara braunii TaxID=69332 RepID=A0A388MC26_CHABU|nr:hypothetical protein CBR_g54417 [Chara braunii]|eukprot:GBG92117.1 hypothetical protein CBR_g54417 [Chara braunii]